MEDASTRKQNIVRLDSPYAKQTWQGQGWSRFLSAEQPTPELAARFDSRRQFDALIGGEVSYVKGQLDRSRMLVLQGEVGAGKSETLYNLALMYQAEGVEVNMLDGHFFNFPGELLTCMRCVAHGDRILSPEARESAPYLHDEENDQFAPMTIQQQFDGYAGLQPRKPQVIMFDATNYLAAASISGGRRLPVEEHMARTQRMISTLNNWKKAIAAGNLDVRLVMTRHTQEWFALKSNPQYTAMFDQLMTGIPRHEVRFEFGGAETINHYYQNLEKITPATFGMKKKEKNWNRFVGIGWSKKFREWMAGVDLSPYREQLGHVEESDFSWVTGMINEYTMFNQNSHMAVASETQKNFRRHRLHKLICAQIKETNDMSILEPIINASSREELYKYAFDLYFGQVVHRMRMLFKIKM